MTAPREISEWMDELHVGENGNEEDGFEVHFMIDPGDGLCSTLAKNLREGDARFIVAACNSYPDLLNAAQSGLDADGHVPDCGNGGERWEDCSPRCMRVRAAIAKATWDGP